MPLITPQDLENRLPLTDVSRATVLRGRQEIEAILSGNDPRPLVVVGPCSIHDLKAAMEYAKRLAELKDKVQDRLCIVMRVYFEKPTHHCGLERADQRPCFGWQFRCVARPRIGSPIVT